MMKLTIAHQESYSRGDLLLRTFFGWLYIGIPHLFLMLFAGIWSSIIAFIAWWAILFTGRYPESFWNYQLGLRRWSLRVNARFFNLVDGYPAFGTTASDEKTNIDMAYPVSLSRGRLLLKTFFGLFYVVLPHGFCLLFRMIASQVLTFLGWWVVLFTGKFPESWHQFITGTIRWQMRVNLYMGLMTDTYPPFSGKE